MFLVVLTHILGQGGIRGNLNLLSPKGIIVEFLYVISLTCVNIYALISGYVGIKSKHKYSNLIQLWIQALFYSIIITIVYVIYTYMNTGVLEVKTLIKGFLPFTFEQYWYFSAYVILFMFMPLLNYLLLNVPRKELKKYATIVFIIYCCFGIIRGQYNSINYGYSFLWLAILYLVGGYVSIYDPFKKFTVKRCIIYLFIILLVTVAVNVLVNFMVLQIFNKQYNLPYLLYYQSPNIVISSILFLIIFSKLQIKKRYQKIITLGASTSFGVYLIHVHPLIYYNLINFGFINLSYENLPIMILAIFLWCIIIYLSCTIIDFIRICIFKLLKIKNISIWIGNLIDTFL